MTMTPTFCPTCGATLVLYRKAGRRRLGGRSHSFSARQEQWVCPVDLAEHRQWDGRRDERGHLLQRPPEAVHRYVRYWPA